MAVGISLCMIVKDEEENLPRCLESVRDLVDEMIIVDTGSKDRTVEIAESYGAKVYYFKWINDFSAARNESLKYASKDWILIMDADDEFNRQDKEKFKILIQNLDNNTTYFFETLCYYGSIKGSNLTVNLNPRLFKNNYGYRYEGAVHNQLKNYSHNVNIKEEPIRIYHYGYLDKSMTSKDKTRRNISILEDEIKKDPKNKFNYFNLGNEYSTLNDREKALENYYKAYEEFDPNTGFASKLIVRIILTNFNLKNYKKALEFVDTGIKYYPGFTDLYYLKGLTLNAQGKPTMAIESFKKCLEMGEPPASLKFIHGTGGFKASYELARIYMKLKDYDEAYKYCIETIRLEPGYMVPLYNIAHIFKITKKPLDEFKKNMESFFSDLQNSYPIVADLFYMEGYYDTALQYIEKYESVKELSPSLKFFKIKCLIRSSKFDECIKHAYSIPINDVYYLQSMMYKILCYALMDNYETASSLIDQINPDYLLDYDKKVLLVYKQFMNLLTGNSTAVLSEDESEKEYTSHILEICEILLVNREFDKFEKILNLFNLISDKSVLLQLGKLYYKHGYADMAKKEIIRSIKLFDITDAEALDILRDCI